MLASGGCDEPFSLVPFSLILSDFRYLFCRCIHFGAAAGCYLTIPVVADCYFVDDLYFAHIYSYAGAGHCSTRLALARSLVSIHSGKRMISVMRACASFRILQSRQVICSLGMRF